MLAKIVVLGPRLRGTRPEALRPLGARTLSRAMEVCVPHSSIATKRLGSIELACLRNARLASSLRYWANLDFLRGQPPPGKRAIAHPTVADETLVARLFERLAVLLEGEVGIPPLEVRGQPLL